MPIDSTLTESFYNFLIANFAADDLRRWVFFNTPSLYPHLPDRSASLAQLAFCITELLSQHGMLTEHLLDTLVLQYPEHRHQLRDIFGSTGDQSNPRDDVAVQQSPFGEPEAFSASIREEMNRIDRAIHLLTSEQCNILTYLRGHHRVAISGCAGSGKTLVAAEKAIRLTTAGLRTLILCHNPMLAEHFQRLVNGSPIDVFDFSGWVRQAAPKETLGSTESVWSVYEEPREDDLAAVFDEVVRGANQYDAVIVDEAQDFRDTWWILIEAVLERSTIGILYIFFDDHQTMFSGRGLPDIARSPIHLSRNCRNAGLIFEIVQRCHPGAPEVTPSLAGLGIVADFRCETVPQAQEMVQRAVGKALDFLPASDLVVLTTEEGPSTCSILHGISVAKPESWRWQDAVRNCLGLMARSFPGIGRRAIPELSEAERPTDEDVRSIREYAYSFRDFSEAFSFPVRTYSWRDAGTAMRLTSRRVDARSMVHFFLGNWAETLPSPRIIKVSAVAPQSGAVIALRSVAEFKGLESNGVILYAPRVGPKLRRSASFYVGVSRARMLLHLVTDHDTPGDLIPQR